MLIPKVALVATGEEGQESFDGTVLYVAVDKEHVEVDDVDLSNRFGRGEEEENVEPNFHAGDEPWEVEDDD